MALQQFSSWRNAPQLHSHAARGNENNVTMRDCDGKLIKKPFTKFDHTFLMTLSADSSEGLTQAVET